ncbi:hypothetical protein ACFQX6_58280 [Streptosporangium lutulentum]
MGRRAVRPRARPAGRRAAPCRRRRGRRRPPGYALFRTRQSFTDHDVPDGELRLKELFGLDPAAYALLWRHLLDRDLISHVKAPS